MLSHSDTGPYQSRAWQSGQFLPPGLPLCCARKTPVLRTELALEPHIKFILSCVTVRRLIKWFWLYHVLMDELIPNSCCCHFLFAMNFLGCVSNT